MLPSLPQQTSLNVRGYTQSDVNLGFFLDSKDSDHANKLTLSFMQIIKTYSTYYGCCETYKYYAMVRKPPALNPLQMYCMDQ